MVRVSLPPLLAPPRKRLSVKPRADVIAAAVEERTSVPTVTDVVPFGYRDFETMEAFNHAWADHERNHFLNCSTRTSVSRDSWNGKQVQARIDAGLSLDADFLASLLPEEMPFQKRVLRCCHGVEREARGKGIRFPAATRYTGCGGRITIQAVRLADGRWVYRTKNEVIRHNHLCNSIVHDSYVTNKLISEADLFVQLRAMLLANAPSRNVCDVVGMLTGKPFSAQQLANFKRDHFGGNTAFANVRAMLTRFASMSGNNCLIIDDDTGRIRAIFMQTAAQRAIFKIWGDNLLFDFTHNTNNAGYYLGSLMVTTATGKGVSVGDFLCTEQTKTMMTALLTHFVSTNENAVERVKSVVIDKDYTEWSVLLDVFPQSRILLCQFHVLKWFALVVTKRKYELDMKTREAVMRILKAMVYVSTLSDFRVQQRLLYDLLRDVSPLFLEYMGKRWYSCRAMWSDCERGDVFTALNTTSNRLEASWNQLKRMLGRRLRMDLCLEAIFAYQTSVLRRELKIISRSAAFVLLRARADPFIRPLCRDASDYVSKQLRAQWDAYAWNRSKYVCVPYQHDEDGNATMYTLETLSPGSRRHIVDCTAWRCSCNFAVTSALPCRHMIFVARDRLGLMTMPLHSVHSRWRMSEAFQIMQDLRCGIVAVQSLRTCLLHTDEGLTSLDELEASGVEPTTAAGRVVAGRTQLATVAHIRLRFNEASEVTVLSNLQKRRRFTIAVADVQKALMAMSTRRFKECLGELRAVFDRLLPSWSSGTNTGDEDDDESFRDVYDPAEHAAVMAFVDSIGLNLEADAETDSCDEVDEEEDDEELAGERHVSSAEVPDLAALPTASLPAPLATASLHVATLHADGSRTVPTPIMAADIRSLNLHIHTAPGVTRLDMAASAAPSARRAYILQKSNCPVSTEAFVRALMHTPHVSSLLEHWASYPRLFTEKCLMSLRATAQIELVEDSRFSTSFVIPAVLVQRLVTAAADVTQVSDRTAPGAALVSRLTTDVRGFSVDNLRAFDAFYLLKKRVDDFVADMAWVRDLYGATGVQSDQCSAILRCANVLSLRTRLCIRTSANHLSTTIEWLDAVGYLGRDARLNYSVMVYSLRQSAADFTDVHVISAISVSGRFELPSVPLSSLRVIVFPVAFDNLHWCSVLVTFDAHRCASVRLVDPLVDPVYVGRLFDFWNTHCGPFLHWWSSQEGSAFHVSSIGVSSNPHQGDVDSSGIYCVMAALDEMRGTRGFLTGACVGPDIVRGVRLQLLWRLVCDSRHMGAPAEELSAKNVLNTFRVFQAKQGN